MSKLLDWILSHEEAFKSRNRLASLYSDFSHQQQTNPDGYHANINAWKKALTDAARAGVIPTEGGSNDVLAISTGEELAGALANKEWGRPLALGAVIHDAVSKKELVMLKDFLNSKTTVYHRSWIPTPWQVLSWSLRQLGVLSDGTHSGGKMAAGNFVVMVNVEAAAAAIQKQAAQTSSQIDLIYSPTRFVTEFSPILSTHHITATDSSILLTYLSRDKPILTHDSKAIKFAAPNTPLKPITQSDIDIANLRDLITSLETQLPSLESRIIEADKAAREAVVNKSIVKAKASLRTKKLVEQSYKNRSDTLLQLQEVYHKITAATDNVAIVKAMESSASVLKNLHKEVGGAEGVEGVVDALREEMGKTDEVSSIINEASANAVDELEVDEEFEALERAEREKKEAEERKERERKEAIERAEREKREAEEAEKTRKRLEELEQLEKERKRKEAEEMASKEEALEVEREKRKRESGEAVVLTERPKKARESMDEEPEVRETREELERVSLDEQRPITEPA